MKRIIKKALPPPLLFQVQRFLRWRMRRKTLKMTTKQIFSEIYANNYWGGTEGMYCSGSGSNADQTDSYCAYVTHFMDDHAIGSVVDLGCGDFRVASKFMDGRRRYIGIDLVDDLISRNTHEFASDNISFMCLDIIQDDLPAADLCLIRQVFQHLSNSQIQQILKKLYQYKYVIVTEHYPSPDVRTTANRDKKPGFDIRVYNSSAVYLDCPPFNVACSKLVLEAPVLSPVVREGETLKTFLIETAQQAKADAD